MINKEDYVLEKGGFKIDSPSLMRAYSQRLFKLKSIVKRDLPDRTDLVLCEYNQERDCIDIYIHKDIYLVLQAYKAVLEKDKSKKPKK